MKYLRAMLCLLLFVCASELRAGGPLYIFRGEPLRWRPGSTIQLHVDQGTLGNLSNEQARDLIVDSVARWEGVPTAAVRFSASDTLEEDVTTRSQLETARSQHNAVIFDTDGALTDELEGQGASNFVIGFASATRFDADAHEIKGGFIVLNGKFVGNIGFKGAVVHELGHLLGLDHTQAGMEYARLFRHLVPLMYPVLVNTTTDPLLDDITWISWLYPSESFGIGRGSVGGKILRANGSPMSGANVLLRAVDNDARANKVTLLSVVSGYLEREGEWHVPAVPPGDYYVAIEPINPTFTGGSSVGPIDAPFRNFPQDFFNGPDESGDSTRDNPSEKVPITIAADSSISGINLITNELRNNLVALADDDSVEYFFPNGFKFPFFGTLYSSVFVNSDGNLTFGKPDSASTARDPSRATSGPPRIAVLFTDLDPQLSGRLAFSQNDTSATFTWRGIPEFDGTEGNYFSATLFSNGDILFDYRFIRVTDDTGPGGSIQMVVGLSAGAGGSGAQNLEQDFSASASGRFAIPVNGSVIETFSETDKRPFDLEGRQLLFVASVNPPAATTYRSYFPFYRADQNLYTGFAFANPTDRPIDVTVSSLDRNGSLLVQPRNPSAVTLQRNQQIARTGGEIFAVEGEPLQSGWLRVESTSPQLATLFQVGDRSGRALDGSLSFRQTATEMILPRVFSGPGAFQGRDAVTTINVVNPNDVGIAAFFRYRSSGGSSPEVRRDIPAGGFLQESFSSLFNLVGQHSNGYVSVSTVGGGAIVFELIEAGDTLVAVNAALPSLERRMYSAHLATGLFGSANYYTNLKVINTSPNDVTIKLRAIDNSGIEFASRQELLLSGQTIESSIDELFNLQGQTRTGTLLIESNLPGLVGDVLFGEAKGDFAADLHLQDRLANDAVCNHVANGELRPGDPNLSYFTGLAFYNPNSVDVRINIEVFGIDGSLVGRSELSLRKEERLAQLVRELVPASASQVGGFVRVKVQDGRGVVMQQLYANNSQKFLSAVPPDVLATAAVQ